MKIFLATLWLAIACASQAHAAFTSPSGWVRGVEGSSYLEWQSFDSSQGFIQAQPDVGSKNVDSVLLRELVGQGFFASSNNIYSFQNHSYVMTVDNAQAGPSIYASSVQVNLQLSTWSNTPDLDSVTLNGHSADITKLYEGSIDAFGGSTQFDYLFSWDINPSSLYVFNFDLDMPHTSLSAVAVDMFGQGSLDSLLALPGLPLLPPLPNDPVFNGTPLAVEDYLPSEPSSITYSSSLAPGYSSSAPNPVPVPAAAWLYISALLGLVQLKKRCSHV